MNQIVRKFTRRVPEWKPRVIPVKQDEATNEQLEALKITPSNTKVSAYVLTLAHDAECLAVRSPLFNAIMYDEGGLSRAERELHPRKRLPTVMIFPSGLTQKGSMFPPGQVIGIKFIQDASPSDLAPRAA